MSRFLFATWEGGGHVQPMLLAAAGLIAQGHTVLAISDACNAPDAAALGIPFRPWRLAPSRTDRSLESDPLKDWLATTPMAVIHGLVDGIICGPAELYARDIAAVIDDFAPDVVSCHELMFGVMMGAEAKGCRLAIFAANVWSLPTLPDGPPFGGGLPPARTDFDRDLYRRILNVTIQAFQCGLPALNAARAAVGLSPVESLFDQVGAAGRILLATSRAFDFDMTLPASFRYVGPYLADPAWTEDWSPPWPGDHRPLVLVSFSTMYQGQDALLRRIIDALGGLDVRGVVTLGPQLSTADFPAPANVAVAARAPHRRILPVTSVAITHVGHASTLRPLMAGAPLVCIPLGRDQPDNAVRVVERGAGLRLKPEASEAEIADAVRALLDDPSYGRNARALGARIAADADARSAEAELIAFAAETRRAAYDPPSAPATPA